MNIPICQICGWQELEYKRRDSEVLEQHDCWQEAGAAADNLALLVPTARATKLGYGPHTLTFLFGDGMLAVTLAVDKKGRFSVAKLHWPVDFTLLGAAEFIVLLAAASRIPAIRPHTVMHEP